MQVTNGILEYIKYLKIEMEKIQQQIQKVEKEKQKPTDLKLKFMKNRLQLELLQAQNLFDLFSPSDNQLFLPETMEYIMNSKIKLPIKVECICYLLNKAYYYYMDNTNVKNDLEEESKFYAYQNEYKKIKTIITDNNWVGYLKESDGNLWQSLEKVGVPEEVIRTIIDTALRNYEYLMIYKMDEEKLKI